MDGLAFLPVGDVKDGMAYLKNIVPEEAEHLFNYFNATYVNGKYRYTQVTNENYTRDGMQFGCSRFIKNWFREKALGFP